MRALIAALTLIIMTSGSTASSSLFVMYREQWGISSADIAVVFSAYVGTLLPVLLFFGGLAERFGRRRVIAAGIVSMAAGLIVLASAHDLAGLIVARLLQGAGVGLSIGAGTAALTETYRGKLPSGNMLQSVAAIGLLSGPVIAAAAFNLGGGLHWSYVPVLALVVALLGFAPFIAERVPSANAPASEEPYNDDMVARALRLALPLAFISWTGLSLFLSLVPAYLATSLHAINPAVGAGAIVAAQLSSLIVTLCVRVKTPEGSGIAGAAAAVGGLALLVFGTTVNSWTLLIIATVLVGAGGGVASAGAFAIAGRVGRGQRARVFARMYVAAYAGYSLPVLALGLLAVRTSFTAAFIAVIAMLAVTTAALPRLRERRACPTCPPEPALAA